MNSFKVNGKQEVIWEVAKIEVNNMETNDFGIESVQPNHPNLISDGEESKIKFR